MKIKVLSLWEPWATLMALGLKEWETRCWYMTHRGPTAIHAAKKVFNPAEWDASFVSQLHADGVLARPMGYGHILAIVDFVACKRTGQVRAALSNREQLYGDFRDLGDDRKQRYAFKAENLRRLARPIAVVGRQGIFYWEVSADVMPLVESSLTTEELFRQ